MFRRIENQYYLEDFVLPFAGKLRADNRWVKMSKLIPWKEIEDRYAERFTSHRGQKAKPVRMALGALIIQETCKFTDREIVAQITENPYLQYFIGLTEYQTQAPFNPSLLVYFRKRFGKKALREINEMICSAASEAEDTEDDDNKPQPPSTETNEETAEATDNPDQESSDQESSFEIYPANQGKLILDATCAPADIRYPTDLSLLNEAREKLDDMIDTIHTNLGKPGKRPRTYRRIARKQFLSIAQSKKPGRKAIRKAIGKQLRYARRNLEAVDRLLSQAGRQHGLSRKQQENLSTIRDLYAQQLQMYTNRNHKISDRIVNISQPHVRPIVRGKAKADVEFGAKVAISMVNGYARIEQLNWDPFNEGNTLIASVESYRQKYGCYPEAVQADKIYRNKENLRYCAQYGIRLSGPKLGRAPDDKELQKEQRRIARQDASERNAVEGKFGEGKRCYSLGRIMARLKETAESVICMQFLVMNLNRRLRVLLFFFLRYLLGQNLAWVYRAAA